MITQLYIYHAKLRTPEIEITKPTKKVAFLFLLE